MANPKRGAKLRRTGGAFRPLDDWLRRAARSGVVPGAVAYVGRSSGVVHRVAVGSRALLPRRERMTLSTIFDLASLTKVLVTAPLVVEAGVRGELSVLDPIERWIEETRGTEVGRIPLHFLLTHTAGFVPDNPMEDYRGSKRALLAAIAREPLESPPATKFTYSDVGYVLLQAVLERRFGKRLDAQAEERIFQPLGYRDTRFGTRERDRSRVAPTERVRGVWLRGRVHDPRTRSRALGGIAGHAGVFGTGEEVARFAAMILAGGVFGGRRILSEAAVRAMTTNQSPGGVGARRGFGFDIESPYSAPRGRLFSSDSFGHTGWTGVSVWIDPVCDGYLVLLTNSIHPNGHKDLKAFRAEAATLAAQGLGVRR
ncbi:MAG: serine hydrolase domain-containing protein [Candidatus Eisenbacteria bacterium]